VTPSTKNWLERLLLLILLWGLIQTLTGLWFVTTLRTDYIRCQADPTCKDRDTATEWDSRRAYVSVAFGQPIQAIGSALLLSLIERSKTRKGHITKAIGIGVLMAASAGLCVLLIYSYYPRPYYWTLDFKEALVLGYYFIFPIFPLASALLGGFSCGLLHWKVLAQSQDN
jgi:hypothetical protein